MAKVVVARLGGMTERRVVLITGATRGIGRAIADALAVDWHVIVGGTQADAVEAVVAELPSASGFVADLLDDAAIESAVAGIERLDALVHSAGIAISGHVGDVPRDEWRRQFEVNVFAVAQLTALCLPLLRASSGQVVTINSGAGFHSGPGNGPYSGSKFALRALSDALREEERGRVRVTSIHPGRVDTDMQMELQAEMGRPYEPTEFLRPDSVAATVKLALDATPDAMIETVTIRPVFKS